MWLIKSTHFWLATTTTIDNVGFLFLFQFRLVETRWTHIINRRTRIAYNRCIESSCTVWLEFFHFWFSSVVRRYSHVSHDLYAKFRLNLSSHLIVCVGIFVSFFFCCFGLREEKTLHTCAQFLFLSLFHFGANCVIHSWIGSSSIRSIDQNISVATRMVVQCHRT